MKFRPNIPLIVFLVIAALFLVASAWKILCSAQHHYSLAVTGTYARVRHPQYVGFILIMIGFLFQWPTLVTLAMIPVLVFMCVHLAGREERDAVAKYADKYCRYMVRTPAFIPRFGGSPSAAQ